MKFTEHLSAHITPEWRKQYIQYEIDRRSAKRSDPNRWESSPVGSCGGAREGRERPLLSVFVGWRKLMSALFRGNENSPDALVAVAVFGICRSVLSVLGGVGRDALAFTCLAVRPSEVSKCTVTCPQLEHPHTVPADGAVGVEVEGHQAFWTCDDKPLISVLTTVPPHTDSLGVSTKTKAGLAFKEMLYSAQDQAPSVE
ncbi:hypothetical protein NFI96_020068, partial [Prochilodus magdalenae]